MKTKNDFITELRIKYPKMGNVVEGHKVYGVNSFFNTEKDLHFLNELLNKSVVVAKRMMLVDVLDKLNTYSGWDGAAFAKKDYRFFLIDDYSDYRKEIYFDGMNFFNGKVNCPGVSGKPDKFIIVIFPIDYYNKIEKQDNYDDLEWLLED